MSYYSAYGIRNHYGKIIFVTNSVIMLQQEIRRLPRKAVSAVLLHTDVNIGINCKSR